MSEILPLNGQSNFDLLLKGYGNFDYFIKMLNDNQILSSSSIPVSKVQIDNSVGNINTNFTNIDYSTYNPPPLPALRYIICEDGSYLVTEDGSYFVLEI